MIICFSGTGNTLAVARRLSRELGEELVKIEGALALNPSRLTLNSRKSKRVVWAFPVYSWGVPPVVRRVIERVVIKDADLVPHYMVATCGDDCGQLARQWSKLVIARGWEARGAASVTMPNIYTLMKGFDVDPAEVEESKLAAMPERVDELVKAISEGAAIDSVTEGKWAWVKTKIIYPWFVRNAMSPKPFHATDACISCGLCSRDCPMDNIEMNGARPRWGSKCALCLRCYHQCPKHAIAYGKATNGKGQYINPEGV